MAETVKRNKWIVLVGKKIFVVKAKGEFHSEFGKINLENLINKPFGTKIKTHLGEEFTVVKPNILDLMKKARRGPQVILPKDAALILAKTGVNKNSIVLDAGSGSGFLAIFLSNFVKKVVTYEKRERHYQIVRENLKLLGIKNVEVKLKDVKKGFDEKEVDLIVLDLESPENVIKHAAKSLKPGGYIAVYCPFAEEVGPVVREMNKKGFSNIEIFENLNREWKITFDKKGNPHMRPEPYVTFTGFLIIGRKYL